VEVSGPVTVNLMFVAIHQLMFLTFAEESQRKESKAERKRKAKLCRSSVDIVVVDGALNTPGKQSLHLETSDSVADEVMVIVAAE